MYVCVRDCTVTVQQVHASLATSALFVVTGKRKHAGISQSLPD